jgi:microsomal dipeptidase-like Zn-dependent dipeptidase
MPEGIDNPSGYARLADALSARKWSDAEVLDFAAGNWMRVFG